jgi:tetratricopeptide (TPR) repeat protein
MTTWRTWWPRIATSVLLLILLAPFAMTLGARSLADVPTDAPSAALPPLPEPGLDAAPSLDGLVDPLPLVVRDLPDDESSQAVEAYDQATLLDSSGGRDMFRHAWASLVIAPQYNGAMDQLTAELMPASLPSSFGSVATVHIDRVNDLLATVMPALRMDPDNADRLNNAAVGLFLYETEVLHGVQPYGDECGQRGSGRFHEGALVLLRETDRAFEPNRTVLLNLSFLTSLTGNVGEATELVSRLLAQNPDDRTARLLLGNLLARQAGAPNALDSAIETLSPLLDHEETEALGHAALGDAWLAGALESRGVSPFLAHERAMQALTEYDLALGLTTDPGVYAGRAAALDLLGAPGDAIAALEQALEHAPSSISLRIGAALLHQRAGNFDQMQEHARMAVESVGGWNPRVVDVRYARIPAIGPYESLEPGYRSFSYGSDQDLAPIYRRACGAGAGYITTLNLFPTPEPWAMRTERFTLAPGAAIELTLSSDVLLGDAEAAASDLNTWDRSRLSSPALANVPMYTERQVVVEAAEMIAGSNTSDGLEQGSWPFAVRQLEDSGQYARASEICERFDDSRCAGIDAYLANDFERASSHLYTIAEPAIERYASKDRPAWYEGTDNDAMAILQAADAAREAGDSARARFLYTIVASREDRSIMFAAIGHTKLGVLELDSGEPGQAMTHLDAALETIHSPEYRDDLEGALPESAAPSAQAMQVAHNNRGVARLWEAKRDSGDAPDCTTHRELCLGAQEDFTTALDADPYNPVYLLNMGWVTRLLGDTETARAYLTESTAIDASLYPSYNDLGVFAASDGDWKQAHSAFMDAVAANPDYDLALWNLGVLELGRGGLGVLSGQGYLARAIERNHDLRDDSEVPTFQKDERIYRVALDAPVGNGFRFSQASSVAAGLLGAISFFAAIKLTLKSLLPDNVLNGIKWMWSRKARLLGRYADPLHRRWLQGVVVTNHVTERIMTTLRQEPFRTIVARLAGIRTPERWRAPLAWIVTLAVLIGVTIWPVWRDGAYVRPALVMLSLYAVLSALVIHEAGHHLAARVMRGRITYTQWSPGMVLAPVLMPFGLNGGPFMCQRVAGVDEERAWGIYLCGPAANLGAALVMYALFQIEPLPMLRLLTTVHLAAAGYALLPFQPLDGAHLIARRPSVASALGFMVTFLSILLVVGIM